MKLRTEILNGRMAFPRGWLDHMKHDALAAHALLQAMEDAKDRWFVTQKDHTDWIKKKADELMREWTGEVG
jgi:hypothetical protein